MTLTMSTSQGSSFIFGTSQVGATGNSVMRASKNLEAKAAFRASAFCLSSVISVPATCSVDRLLFPLFAFFRNDQNRFGLSLKS